MLRLPYIYIAFPILCINFNLSAQINTSSILTSRSGAQVDAPVLYTSYGIMDGTHTLSTALAHREGVGHRFSFDNPLSAKYRPFDRPVTPMRSGENDKDQETKAYMDIDIGIISNRLVYSEILHQGYSGLGLVIDMHWTEHLELTYKRNYWQIKAADPESDYTPFYSFQTPMNVMTLRSVFYYKQRMLFAHFGYAWTERKIGPDKWHGLVYGFGYRRPLHGNINFSIIIDRRILAQLGLVDGKSWDVHSELGVEISYRMNIGEFKKKIAKKLRNKEEAK